MEPIRLAIVASHPIQHFCPLYRALAADPRVDLRVLFASDAGARPYYDPAFGKTITWGVEILAGFDHELLAPDAESIAESVSAAHPGPALSVFAPDVIQVYGHGDAMSRRALAWAAWHRRPSVMVSDSELLAPRSLGKALAKRALLPLLYGLPAGFLTIGDENERYLRHYGVSRRRLYRCPIPIDSPAIDASTQQSDLVRTDERISWGAHPEDVVLLAVGKSIPRKRHADLVQAVAMLPVESRRRALIVLAGGGESLEPLVSLAKQLDVRVQALGFVPVDRLFRTYLGADVLVHPSEADPHPLAVAEGVYCGLPVLVSDRVGSWGATDDVRPGVNGLRFPIGDVSALSGLLRDLIQDVGLRAVLAEGSRKVGQTRTLEESSRKYVEGLSSVLRRRR